MASKDEEGPPAKRTKLEGGIDACAYGIHARTFTQDWSRGSHGWNGVLTSSVLFPAGSAPSGGPPSLPPVLPASTPYEVSRVMQPDDSNPSGNVHGGTILKLIENAGGIVASRHCNKYGSSNSNQKGIVCVLARVDHMDFHQPMFVGEIAQLQAAVTYTSPHSMEVTVDVWSENLLTGQKRHTNTARLWYVGVPMDLDALQNGAQLRPVPVPPLKGLTPEEMEEGRKRYVAQKTARAEDERASQGCSHIVASVPHPEAKEHTVLASQTTLANIVLPSDCTTSRHLTGGSLMKMMDNAAGICAARHCRSRPVTACIDAIDFHSPIRNGEVVFVTARMVFTSAKSMEIEVTTEAEGIQPGSRRITNTAYFTFVALGKDCHALPVPSLVLEGEEERERYEEGRRRYLERKAARQKMMEQFQKASKQ